MNKKRTFFYLFFSLAIPFAAFSDERINYLFDGNVAYAKKDFLGAKQAYLNAIAQDSKNAKAYYGLGAAEFSIGEMESAEKHFKNALELSPNFQAAQAFLESILVLLPLAEKQRTFPDTMKQGFDYLHDNDFLRAASSFRQAIALNQNSAHAHYYLGLCLAKLGAYNAATGEFEKCLSLDPGNADAKAKLYQIVSGKDIAISMPDSVYLGSLLPPRTTAKVSPMGSIAAPDLDLKTSTPKFRWTFQTSPGFTGASSGGQPVQDIGWILNTAGGLLYNSSFLNTPYFAGYFLGAVFSPNRSFELTRLQHRISVGLSAFQKRDVTGSLSFDEILVHEGNTVSVQKHQGSFSVVGPNLELGVLQSNLSVQNVFYGHSQDYNGNIFSGSIGIQKSVAKEQTVSFDISGGRYEASNAILINNFEGLSLGYSWGGGNQLGISVNVSYQIQDYPNSFVASGEMRRDYLTGAGLGISVPLATYLNVSVGYQFGHINSNFPYYFENSNNVFGNLSFPFL